LPAQSWPAGSSCCFLPCTVPFHAQHWKGAWVGFDLILLASFAATGWAFWRGRQIVIAFLIVTGTLLCCDAWFDIFLDLGSSDIWVSVATAVVAELPDGVPHVQRGPPADPAVRPRRDERVRGTDGPGRCTATPADLEDPLLGMDGTPPRGPVP